MLALLKSLKLQSVLPRNPWVCERVSAAVVYWDKIIRCEVALKEYVSYSE